MCEWDQLVTFGGDESEVIQNYAAAMRDIAHSA